MNKLWVVVVNVDGVEQYVSRQNVNSYTTEIVEAVTYNSSDSAYKRYINTYNPIVPFKIVALDIKLSSESVDYNSIRQLNEPEIFVMMKGKYVGVGQQQPTSTTHHTYYIKGLVDDVRYAKSFKNLKSASKYVDECIVRGNQIKDSIETYDEYYRKHAIHPQLSRINYKLSHELFVSEKLEVVEYLTSAKVSTN